MKASTHFTDTATLCEPRSRATACTDAIAHLDTRQLFHRGNTVVITHGEQCYTLRLTRENKLILTK